MVDQEDCKPGCWSELRLPGPGADPQNIGSDTKNSALHFSLNIQCLKLPEKK